MTPRTKNPIKKESNVRCGILRDSMAFLQVFKLKWNQARVDFMKLDSQSHLVPDPAELIPPIWTVTQRQRSLLSDSTANKLYLIGWTGADFVNPEA